MSAKKRSFDLEPKRTGKKPAHSRKKRPTREIRRPRKKTLRERREDAARTRNFGITLLVLISIGGLLYALWLPQVRIHNVLVTDVQDAPQIESLAKQKLQGTYWYVIPRDSFFFYPEKEIRDAVLSLYPVASAVSISRNGFTSITLSLSARKQTYVWCGAPSEAVLPGNHCYDADIEGIIFQNHEGETATTTIRVFDSLTASTTDSSPLRARLASSGALPNVLRFAHALEAFGTPVSKIAVRGDEADVYVSSGTRITYVIGKERETLVDAQAAFPSVNLADGSITYIDLRFRGKVYLKRKGE